MQNLVYSGVIDSNGDTSIDIGASGSNPAGHNALPGQKATFEIYPGEDWSAGTIKLQEDDDNDATYTDISGATLTGAANSPPPLIMEITLHENMNINAASMAGDGARVVIRQST